MLIAFIVGICMCVFIGHKIADDNGEEDSDGEDERNEPFIEEDKLEEDNTCAKELNKPLKFS